MEKLKAIRPFRLGGTEYKIGDELVGLDMLVRRGFAVKLDPEAEKRKDKTDPEAKGRKNK